ncbi:MAG: hypothetical protein GX294_05660 [Candidatus Cloacimonetes bacterium]|nr:hypothetical protein [Candidatus Cloacimonadota bacterium]
MKEIIRDLRTKLDGGFFEKEEHVRIAIVARICMALGWDIWNPQEFYTEYPIRMKGRDGSVDVALFHSDLKDRTPDVFIEIKAVGKLKGNIESSEDQLQEYNFYNTASITVLTDGKVWRFYLSSATGTFAQKLFCTINIMENDEDFIQTVFQNILSKSRYALDAVNYAKKMHSDLRLSKDIERAKREANQRIDENPALNMYQLVQLILRERGREFGIEEIKRLWGYKSGVKEEISSQKEDSPAPDKFVIKETPEPQITIGGINDSYTYRNITRIFIVDEWHEVRYWWEAKKVVYERFYDELKNADLPKRMRIMVNKSDHYMPFTLDSRGYVEGHGAANTILNDIKRVLSILGYDPQKDIKIESQPSGAKKRVYR